MKTIFLVFVNNSMLKFEHSDFEFTGECLVVKFPGLSLYKEKTITYRFYLLSSIREMEVTIEE